MALILLKRLVWKVDLGNFNSVFIQVFGSSANDVVLTEDQKKILEATRKKESKVLPVTPVVQAPDLGSLLLANVLQSQQAGGSAGSNLLALLGAGKKTQVKRRTIDKSEHLCFRCQQVGHWATDEICPKYKKKDEEEK